MTQEYVDLRFRVDDMVALAKAFKRALGPQDAAYARATIKRAMDGSSEAFAVMVGTVLAPKKGLGSIGLTEINDDN